MLNLNTQEIRQLTFDPESDHTSSWSRHERRIAFQSKRTGNYDIFVMNADGGNQVASTSHPADDYRPAWSPDGTQILFESRQDGGDRSQLYLMSADGSHQLRLMESNGNDGMPAWSPTGEIAFYSNRDGNRELYLMEGLGTMPRRLTTNLGDDWFPAWSPDGRFLAFTSGSEIHVLDTANQNISQLARFGTDSADPIIVFAMIPHF